MFGKKSFDYDAKFFISVYQLTKDDMRKISEQFNDISVFKLKFLLVNISIKY